MIDDYDLLPCGVFILDFSGKVHYCNRPFASAMGLSVESIVNASIDDFLSNGSKIIYQQVILPSIINNNEVEEVQLNFLTADKRKLPMVIFANYNKNTIIFCCFSATERKKILSSLSESRSELQEANVQLKKLSTIDELTGCINRRELKNKMKVIRRQAQRRQSPCAILMLDLDNFKKLNDTHGHVEGDYVLKQFANVLMEGSRFDDVVARYGGEEFLMILPDTNERDALIAADSIHGNIKKIRTKAKVVTVSIGICIVSSNNDSSDKDIIAIADKALYTSKTTGKSKTTLLPLE